MFIDSQKRNSKSEGVFEDWFNWIKIWILDKNICQESLKSQSPKVIINKIWDILQSFSVKEVYDIYKKFYQESNENNQCESPTKSTEKDNNFSKTLDNSPNECKWNDTEVHHRLRFIESPLKNLESGKW